MKPLRLVVQAFGPYAGRETFDFGKLLDRSLFLISGPTGSGKSTVLDAMCCALYGVTSGIDRTPQQMRSDHAARNTPTEVIFDFRLGARDYRVSRRLEHQRPKLRGDGFTTDPQTATLWERTGISDPDDEGTPLASQWEKVTKKIEELLGFSDGEFRQVVLIPQGRFRDLLVADSKAREEILVTLFRTRHFNAIERALKDAWKEIEARLQRLKQNREGVLKFEGVETLDALNMLAADLAVQQAAARVDADGFRLGKARADEVLAEGLRVKGLLDQRDMALVDRQALEARTGEMAAVRVEAERGRAALGLQDAQEEATRRVGEWQTLNEALAAAQIARARAVEAADAARTRLEAEKAREPQQVANQRQATLLEGLVDKAAGIAQARAQLDDARLVAEKAGAALDAAHQALESLAAEVAAGKAALDDAERRGATLEAGELASQKAVARLRQRQELETARKTLARAETDHGHARQALEVARGKYQKARDALDQADEAMREGAAGLLAKTLKDGEPCPVCGSASHPVPAHGDENLPDPKVVEDLRRNLRKLEEEVAAAGERENALQAQVAASQARVELILGDLGPLAETDVESLERECSEAAKRVADANAALRARDGLVQAQADRETRHSGMVAEIEVLRQQSNGAVASLKAAGATVDEREKTVPEAWRDPAVLELERQRLARELAAMKTALDKANAAHQGAVQNLASCDARVKAATSASDGAKALADQRREAFLERVAAAGFESEGAYTEARRTSDELAALDSRVESWTQALAAARDRRKRADDAAGDLTRPDMDALGKAAAQAGQDLDLAVETASRLAQQVDQKRKTIESLRKDAAAMEAMELEYGVLGSLSEAANGNNSRKITFQRYVLGALLDDVLVAATTRLKQMTGGRYLLQRVGQVGDRRRLAGLDLEVMDTYTGINRPVGTLSGGESFMAALSLALGMADVVQSYSGGIRLETIFIDEGFGSLDPEALDQALRELVKLKEGGRLVGIISHVPELKQRIDARLEVSADRTGSHARFVVG